MTREKELVFWNLANNVHLNWGEEVPTGQNIIKNHPITLRELPHTKKWTKVSQIFMNPEKSDR